MKTACESFLVEIKGARTELGTEGLVDRFILKTLDAFVRLFANQIHVIGKLFTGEIRSEYKYYLQSNATMSMRIRSLNYTDVRLAVVDVPNGMFCSYNVALTRLVAIIKRMDPVAVTSEARTLVTGLISDTGDGVVSAMKSATSRLTIYSKKGVAAELKDVFVKTTSTRLDKKPFGEVFASMSEFCDVGDALMGAEVFYNQLISAHKDLVLVNSMIGTLLDDYESGKVTLDKSVAIILQRYLYTVAEQLDIYALLISELQRIEHNYVLVMRELGKHA